jgi:3',5'-cyclic AMP phosphodiesterase CpdA
VTPLQLGLIADVHLNPAGTAPVAWHNPYRLADAAQRFTQALNHCCTAGADAIVVLGDLTHFGDDTSLHTGVALAAACDRPVYIVPGNHDVAVRPDALLTAIADVSAPGVQLAPPDGVVLDGVRLAGLAQLSAAPDWGATALALPLLDAWGDDLVVYLSHYPLLSLAARAQAAGLQYPGDLTNLSLVRVPFCERAAPTIVVHGHAHVRAAEADGVLLQLACAALIEPPFDVSLLTIERTTDATTVQLARMPLLEAPQVRLPILSPVADSWIYQNHRWFTR